MVAVAVEDRVEVVDWGEDGLCNVVTKLCYDQGFVTDVTWQEQNPNLLVTSSTKQEIVALDGIPHGQWQCHLRVVGG